MKMLILAFITALSFSVHAKSLGRGHEIKEYSKLSYDEREAKGYTTTSITEFELKAPLLKWIKSTTNKKLADWKKFVFNGGEYDHLSKEAKAKIAVNPLQELQVKSLLQIGELIEIKKNGKSIGYFIEVADHVQAAIYQDGAWYDLYVDPDMNVILSSEQSS